MKVLSANDNHIKKPEPEKEYGCTCCNCGTVFVFKRSEARANCSIMCPNCKHIMPLAQCKEFKDLEEKKYFEYYYDE